MDTVTPFITIKTAIRNGRSVRLDTISGPVVILPAQIIVVEASKDWYVLDVFGSKTWKSEIMAAYIIWIEVS